MTDDQTPPQAELPTPIITTQYSPEELAQMAQEGWYVAFRVRPTPLGDAALPPPPPSTGPRPLLKSSSRTKLPRTKR